MLSAHNRSEFLATPQLVRFEHGRGRDGLEPTLLIKGDTLLLKYIVLGAGMQLAFAECENRLLCALRVFDDGNGGGILWSVVERDQEVDAILGLARGETLVSFLFNEIAVNVAWRNLPSFGKLPQLAEMVQRATLGQVSYPQIKANADVLLEQFHQEGASEWIVLEVGGHSDWNSVQSHYLPSGAGPSLIDIFDRDEGNQQEQICLWLTDNLLPFGVHHSPQIPKGHGTRELTDILLSHEFGSILIESKALSVLTREKLPDRAKLRRDISSHIRKAFKQLRGAIRSLKSGVPVTSLKGHSLSVERDKPAHAIVLVPDLLLIDDPSSFGLAFMREFMEATGAFTHLLDISELLRVVQAAEMIASRGHSITPMQAFDYYLMQRAEKALEVGTICFEMLLRFADDPSDHGA